MTKNRSKLATKNSEKGSLRPVLIASEHILFEYSTILGHLLVGLADESIPTVLVCPPDRDFDCIISGAVEVIRHPILQLPFLGWLNIKRLVEQLSKFKPTILHCLCESKAHLTRQLARQLDLPYILTINSLHKRWDTLSISSKRCAKIIVPAKTIAENISSLYARFAKRIEQINIGTFTKEDNGCFCETSRLATLLTAHPLDNVNDFENLFNAVRHLSIEGYEFMMAIIGNGRAERNLRKLLTALGLSQNVTFVTGLRPLRSVLAAGDIFVQPQPMTAFNPLLLEAMSVGSAVAACKGGVDDLVIENQTAIVFDPKDELSIKGSLQRLLDKPDYARHISKKAQQYLRENHTVTNMISATIKTYHNAQK